MVEYMKEPFISKLHLKKKRRRRIKRVNVIHIRKKKVELKKVNHKQKKRK